MPTSLLEDPIRPSPKESVSDLRNLFFGGGIIVVLCSFTHSMFTGVSSDSPRYNSIRVILSPILVPGKGVSPSASGPLWNF